MERRLLHYIPFFSSIISYKSASFDNLISVFGNLFEIQVKLSSCFCFQNIPFVGGVNCDTCFAIEFTYLVIFSNSEEHQIIFSQRFKVSFNHGAPFFQIFLSSNIVVWLFLFYSASSRWTIKVVNANEVGCERVSMHGLSTKATKNPVLDSFSASVLSNFSHFSVSNSGFFLIIKF